MHQSVELTDAIWLLQLVISYPLIHALSDPSQGPTGIQSQVPRLRGRQLTNWAIPPLLLVNVIVFTVVGHIVIMTIWFHIADAGTHPSIYTKIRPYYLPRNSTPQHSQCSVDCAVWLLWTCLIFAATCLLFNLCCITWKLLTGPVSICPKCTITFNCILTVLYGKRRCHMQEVFFTKQFNKLDYEIIFLMKFTC